MRTSASLQRELLGKRIISYFIEWCSTPKKEYPGFACQDTCKMFDKDGAILQTVVKSPDLNIYTCMDVATLDPVLDCTASGVYNFLSSTFWSNKVALKCQFVAMCLSLRGVNIDRAFWTVGPGGVGQSLNTHLIANMFGSNHGFVDMQVYYSDDELRKQAESPVDKTVVTGQESPVTDRTMRSDLYKKHMSADPVACRPPYGIVARMLQLNGWTRSEMNDPLHFTGVTEATFPSMKRRALVIVMKARFESTSRLEQLFPNKDHASHGCFPVDQSFKAFLTSSPASAALFRILFGFARTHAEAQCRDIIENYVETGLDAGITEKTMRAACGLPQQGMERSACAPPIPTATHAPSWRSPLPQPVESLVPEVVGEQPHGSSQRPVGASPSVVASVPAPCQAFQSVAQRSVPACLVSVESRARSGSEGCISLRHSTSAQCDYGGLDSMRVVEGVAEAE